MTLIVKGENYASQLMVAGQYSDCSDIHALQLKRLRPYSEQ